METESETLLAAAVESLKVLDTVGHSEGHNTTEQEEDCFFDCEETPIGQSGDDHTELSHRTKADHEKVEEQNTEETPEPQKSPDTTDNYDVNLNTHEAGAAEKDNNVLSDDGEYDKNKEEDSDSELLETPAKVAEFDDEYLREAEKNLTDEEKESRKAESTRLKDEGNAFFKNGDYAEAQQSYTAALAICPVYYSKERSILFSNRAAARIHLDDKPDAISDCSKAIELNPEYVRAILRRAELYEKTDKLDEALEDYKTVLEKEPGNPIAREACCRLPQQIQERNEKLKEEMLGKLKDLGNMILRPFGLSTQNFQVNQDENTGSYSVNFVQNPNNNR